MLFFEKTSLPKPHGPAPTQVKFTCPNGCRYIQAYYDFNNGEVLAYLYDMQEAKIFSVVEAYMSLKEQTQNMSWAFCP